MKLYEELETGAECERLAPTLVALASGTATSEALLDLRPHLRNCPACRATVRRTPRVPAPPAHGLDAAGRDHRAGQGVRRALPRTTAGRGRRAAPDAARGATRRGVPAVERGRVVGAASGALGGRGRRADLQRTAAPARLARGGAPATPGSDLALGVHAATSSGGGRISALAALIGVCLSGVGAGTYCVATALLPDPKPAIHASARAAAAHKSQQATRHKRLPTRASQAVAPTPIPTPTRARPVRHTTPRTPKSHEQSPISPAQASTQDFSFEQTAANPGPSHPAAAPATGGSEFEP